MEQYEGFQNFDQEQQMKRRAIQRRRKGIQQLNQPESENWLFSTDLDQEIDWLTNKLEATSCH